MLSLTLGLLTTFAAPLNYTDPALTVPAQDAPFAIRASRVVIGNGSIVENGLVLVQNGKIVAVGDSIPLPEGIGVVEHEGTLSAGMIVLHDYSASAGEVHDSTRPVLDGAELVYAFDRDHSDLRRALEAGITTVVIAPSPQNLAGGVTAVVKTHEGRVLKERGHLALSLSGYALGFNRYPTSYPAAMRELDARFADEADQNGGAFAEAGSGQLPVMMQVATRADVLRAVDFAQRHKLSGALSGAMRAGEVADSIAAANLSVVLRPFGSGTSRRAMETAVTLAELGVPFAFGLDAPNRSPQSLRFGAALCVRSGLAPAAAWKALTTHAARIAGVADRVGMIEGGNDADLVLWSGDPLDLGSSIEAVYVDGEKVLGDEE